MSSDSTSQVHELNFSSPGSVGAHDVVFDCPECHKSLVVDRAASGHELECPLCQKLIAVPGEHRVVTLDEAPETAMLRSKPQWEQDLLVLENSLKEARHQREEAGNAYKHHVSEANRLKLRVEKLDARLREIQLQREALLQEHPTA